MPPNNEPLLRELIHIPERTSTSDFVLRLTDGVTDAKATLNSYVITERLTGNFDEALGLIRSTVETGTSKAAYLHGSFGSGKSHFMAVLHALLRRDPAARARDEFAALLAKHDSWLTGRKFLLVPFYLIGAKSMEQRVLGGYVEYVRKLHPDAPIPAVHRTDALLDNARDLRSRIGDEQFINGLPGGTTVNAEDDEWGEAEPEERWTTAKLDAAMAGAHDDQLRRDLVNDLLTSWSKGFFRNAQEDAEGFVSLDRGLTEIAGHAKSLGYDGLVLFLDELILWLANSVGDQRFVTREAQKINNFVEGGDARRPIPITSFIARQRDLRELAGETVTGAVELSFQDTLNLARGRFDVIHLEDRNLPAVAKARVLKPTSAEAEARISQAFEGTASLRREVWDTLLGEEGTTGSDLESFRATYPFSPAFMDTLVHVSNALQRARTGLKLMRELLVEHREELRLGQLVPLGDLYEVVSRGDDQPFTEKLKAEFETAQKLYQTRLRPYLLESNHVSDEDVERVRRGTPVDAETAGRVRAFAGEDRLIKTLLLSALAPTVPALRNLTPAKLSALNHGSITSPVKGGEVTKVARRLEDWAGKFGEIKVSTGDDRSVSLELIDVDINSILQHATHLDTSGERKALVNRLLWDELKVTESTSAGRMYDQLDLVWRGSKRSVEVLFGNVRDPEEFTEEAFHPFEPGAWRVLVDYPFDEPGYNPNYDRNRVQELQAQGDSARTVCWIPASLTQDRLNDLRQLVMIEGVLSGQQFDTYAQHLNPTDRHRARQTLQSQRDWLHTRLRGVLRQAYGLARKDPADVNTDYDEHLLTLAHGLGLRLPLGAAMADALRDLAGQMLAHQYPAHPDFDPDRHGITVRAVDAKRVLDYVRQASERPDGRVEVDRNDRQTMRRVANPLQLGEMHEAAFVLERHWPQEFHHRAAQAGITGDLKVADLLKWLDEPSPRGLESHVANLVVASFAEQTDRMWVRYGAPLNQPPELTSPTRDLALRLQNLPDESTWKVATKRAEEIFDISAPTHLRGRLVGLFVHQISEKAARYRDDAHLLVRRLEEHAGRLGIDPSATTGRLATARAAADLLDGLGSREQGVDVINHLAGAELGGPPARTGTSITSAKRVAAALDHGPWDNLDVIQSLGAQYESTAEAILGRLREAARADELTTSLTDALGEAGTAVKRLLLQVAEDQRRWEAEQHRPVVPKPSDEDTPVPQPTRPAPTGSGSEDDEENGGIGPVDLVTPPQPGAKQLPWGSDEVIGDGQLERVLKRLRDVANEHPTARIQIHWKVVE